MLKDLFLLDPQVIFLNHGSYGACPRPVFKIYQQWQRRLESQPVQFLGVELDNYLLQSRQALGRYINAPASDLVFVPNATHGVNIVARSVHLHPGDEVLTTDHEYGACNFTWEYICRQADAAYKLQTISLPATTPKAIAEQLWQAITPRTKVIFISHLTSPTSLCVPIRMICHEARQAGIITVIDGAHAPGQVTLDMQDLQADFYTGNCHKWMLSPKGAGFLYARPEVQHMIEPLVVSWGYQSYACPSRESRFIDYLQWTGTKDPAAALSVPAAIEFMQEQNWTQVQANCHGMLRNAMERMCKITNIEPIYPLDSNYYYQMGTIPIPRVKDLKMLKTRLYSEYKIEIPCFEWNKKHFIRASVQGYNSQVDLDQLVNAMDVLLPALKE
jgi:isopenicillin-N epimerase